MKNPNVELHEISVPLSLRRRGVQTKLIYGDDQQNKTADPLLVSTIANANSWFKDLVSERSPSINEIARGHGIPASEISRLPPLVFLAPDIVEASIVGKQPVRLTTKHLTRFQDLSLDWNDQSNALNF